MSFHYRPDQVQCDDNVQQHQTPKQRLKGAAWGYAS